MTTKRTMNTTSSMRHTGAAPFLAGAALAVTAMIGSLLTPATAVAEVPIPAIDGLTQETAAASCWEIKQNVPSAADGVYWIVTPELVAPEQFYCDQTTDGGGWVLIGRGRDAWKEGYNGLRTAAQIRNTPSGTGAFLPAQLPSTTIDGLLDGGRVDALSDGIRLRRASNTAGSQWQEARFKLTQRDRWVWTFGAEHRVSQYSFGSSNGSGGQTNNFGNNNQYNRVVFSEQSSHGYRNGWAFGSGVTGSTSDTSYLWSPSGQGYARPFTQVFLRPKLMTAALDYGTIPAEGTEATTLAAIPDSNALTTTWGVSGFANGNSGELNTEVAAFGEIDGKVFVGGNFKYVQRTEGGADQVQQSYLAAFDVGTGQWSSAFRPVLNGQVKAINALPDGRIAVGGQFSSVNGTAQTALAFLDPNTGELSGTQVQAENRSNGGVAYVRNFDVQDDYLYVAGAFTHLTSPSTGVAGGAWNGGRIALSSMRPDTNWNAFLNGTSVGLDASDQGDRIYFSGYFRMKSTAVTPSAAAIQTAAGAPLMTPAWKPRFSKSGTDAAGNITGNVWQLGVAEAGDKVWLGGSEHSLFAYDRNDFSLLRGSITKSGGDFQAVETNGALVIGGCHCGHWVYQDTFTWDGVGTGWAQADKMNLVGAWDATTGDYVPAWSPTLSARAGYGAWGSFYDSTGVLWVGGDFSRSLRAGEVAQWSGGYVRFAPRDATAPTTPGPITATPASGGADAALTWGASSDAGGVAYEVLRGDRVIATTNSTAYTVPVTAEPVNYFVRARDAVGNRSASTAAFVVEPAPASALTFVANGASWSWRYSTDALPATWNALDFDDSSWQTGEGVLARGVTTAATDIDPTNLATKPLSAQFRTRFEVEDALTVTHGSISVIADDGVVVYLNGVELGRVRLPSGALTQNSYATGVISASTAAASRTAFEVPAGLLVDGTNIIAASVHANYRGTTDLSFDLAFTAERGDAPEAPGAVEGLDVISTADSAVLTWMHPLTGGTPTGYTVARNGEQVATTDAATTTYTDTGLTPETAYEYVVTASGPGTLTSPPATVTTTTAAAPGDDELPVTIPDGATWAWRSSGDGLPTDWNAAGFDDSGWAIGQGLFGRGVSGSVTDLDPDALATKPLSAQFRHSFTVVDTSTVQDGTVTVIANDGVAVYLNGTELGRANLPTGTLTQNSYATAAPRHGTAAANRVAFTVPAALLVEGDNVLAASVHANYRSTPDISFDLSLSMLRG